MRVGPTEFLFLYIGACVVLGPIFTCLTLGILGGLIYYKMYKDTDE